MIKKKETAFKKIREHVEEGTPLYTRNFSPELRDDADLMLTLIKLQHHNLTFASERLKSDKAFVIEVVKMHPDVIRRLFTDDKEVVLEAVKQDGGALLHASDRLRDDPEVVLEAYKAFGGNDFAIFASSERLKRLLDKDPNPIQTLETLINKEILTEIPHASKSKSTFGDL